VPDVTTDHAREELHKLLDHVPAAEVPLARKFLQSLVDPVDLALLNARPDDEPETTEERAAVEAALADPAADVPFSQIRRRA
jgi:hypothetical protein